MNFRLVHNYLYNPLMPIKFDPGKFRPNQKTFSSPKGKKAVKKKSTNNLPVLMNLADSLVRAVLIKKHSINGASNCFTCGIKMEVKFLEVGHFVKRQYTALRWDLRNTHFQCIRCNHELDGNVIVYADKLDQRYGMGTAEGLIQESKKPFKLDRITMNEIIESLKD